MSLPAFVLVQLRLVTPVFNLNQQQPIWQFARTVLRIGWFIAVRIRNRLITDSR